MFTYLFENDSYFCNFNWRKDRKTMHGNIVYSHGLYESAFMLHLQSDSKKKVRKFHDVS